MPGIWWANWICRISNSSMQTYWMWIGTGGQFDYIICHGIYSWVLEAVREKLLKICSSNLVSNGVALVSYNTYPGCRWR